MIFARLLMAALLLCSSVWPATAFAQGKPIDGYKEQLVKDIDAMRKQTQVINDMLFSFSELGFQEHETARYLTELLEKEGFKIERGIAGLPTAWMATWTNGTGKPVVALGSDVDGIPQASQKPGVAYHEPLVGRARPRRGTQLRPAVNITPRSPSSV